MAIIKDMSDEELMDALHDEEDKEIRKELQIELGQRKLCGFERNEIDKLFDNFVEEENYEKYADFKMKDAFIAGICKCNEKNKK